MQKINAILTATIILMAAKSPSLLLLVRIILLRVQNWVTTLHNFYLYLIHPLIHLLSCTCKNSAEGKKVSAPIVLTPKYCNAKTGLFSGEVEIVMEKLGFYCDPCGDQFEERIGYEEIANLFNKNEPSLEEVKEAFDVFDKNRDGYIDGKELKEVICRLGFTEFGERDCQRMITAFDDNGDGLVDFTEFLKLVQNSF